MGTFLVVRERSAVSFLLSRVSIRVTSIAFPAMTVLPLDVRLIAEC